MYSFLFDRKSLILLVAGLATVGGLLFVSGLLVGVVWGVPGAAPPPAAPSPRPAAVAQSQPCPPQAEPGAQRAEGEPPAEHWADLDQQQEENASGSSAAERPAAPAAPVGSEASVFPGRGDGLSDLAGAGRATPAGAEAGRSESLRDSGPTAAQSEGAAVPERRSLSGAVPAAGAATAERKSPSGGSAGASSAPPTTQLAQAAPPSPYPEDSTGRAPEPGKPASEAAAPSAQTAPTPPFAAGEARFSLQVGAYRQAENSSRAVQELQRLGYDAYVVAERGALRTVRIGRYADVAEAQRAAAEFRRREGRAAIVRSQGS